jgi:hypothetical protein
VIVSGSRQLLIGLKRTGGEYRDSAEDVSKLDAALWSSLVGAWTPTIKDLADGFGILLSRASEAVASAMSWVVSLCRLAVCKHHCGHSAMLDGTGQWQDALARRHSWKKKGATMADSKSRNEIVRAGKENVGD